MSLSRDTDYIGRFVAKAALMFIGSAAARLGRKFNRRAKNNRMEE
jgi:hypothetical protein